MASAIGETIVDTVVTREYLDPRLAELKADTATKLAELKAAMLKWMFGAIGLQILAIRGGVAALFRLLG